MKENLLKDAGINDRARKVSLRGKQVIVPLKFDEDGEPATQDKLIFKRLSLTDLRFLKALKGSDWNIARACEISGISLERSERLVKKLACFREEDARVKALCEIPTPDWIAAKHVQNVYEGGVLQDSEHKSLQELAKIEGAYKNTSQVNVNVVHSLQLPKLTPEQEAQFRELGDSIATTAEKAA